MSYGPPFHATRLGKKMTDEQIIELLNADRLARNIGHKLRLVEDLEQAKAIRGEDTFALLCRMSRDPDIRPEDRPGIERALLALDMAPPGCRGGDAVRCGG